VLKITLPFVDTNGSVKKLTLFLHGLASLQSSRTQFSVTWLQIFRPSTKHHRIWRTSTTFPKTSHPCYVNMSTYKVCTSELNVNNSTTLRLPHRLPSISTEARVKENEVVIVCCLPCVFLNSVCSCLECFLSVYCYLVLVLVFGLLALKTHWCVKEPWLGNLSILCVPPYRFMLAWVG
jgi:hypothetical protein